MEKIKISLDRGVYWQKPPNEDIPKINNRIAGCVHTISPTEKEIKELTERIGIDGQSFCPATFKNGKRNQENFEQQQIFALDFDNKDSDRRVSFEEIKERAARYDLPVLFAYDTFSSKEHNKFRVVFLNDASICHRKVAEAMQEALGMIFPEADPRCYKDISKMYFGGKERRYFDSSVPTINIESVFRGMTYWLKDTKGNHYKEKLSKFSQETGIALTKNGLLDVTASTDPTETTGANQSNQNGKISPSPITYTSYNIIANGENFPKYYHIRFADCTSKSSVVTSVNNTDVTVKEKKNHKTYRSSDLKKITQRCRLLQEFETGERDMTHDELFGLATNLIQVETGIKKFKEIQAKYPEFYDGERRRKWERHLSFIYQQEYKPQNCDHFCPYNAQCSHGTNILSTVCARRGLMEKIPKYHEDFYSLEDVQEDAYNAIYDAYCADDNRIYVIKAMTSVGKTFNYLRLMSENSDKRFLIAASSNLLKNEIYKKAKEKELNVRRTPSLDEIKGEIPRDVWEKIQKLRDSGCHNQVHPYIQKVIKESHTSALEKYMKEREKLKNFDGIVITTHRYLLSMDFNRIKEFDAVIIDEDILFKSVISNQGEVTISKLKKLKRKSTDKCVRDKIKELLKLAEEQSCIELDGFDYNADTEKLTSFDLPAFCGAEYFYVRRQSKERNLKEDTVSFLKPVFFHDVKYIIVSATADERIYHNFFAPREVVFHECKKAEYLGRLLQHPGKSMSRTCVSNNPGIIPRLMKRFNVDSSKVITFMRENIGKLHFGNTEGSNTLEGQNILVVGTPYHADFLYKLVAFSMGYDFDEDEEVEPQVVIYNGYRFRFTTFNNENLRAVQFWMIESELEQAVGRARLLRNSCDVYLFSNFPLSQAQMVDDFDYEKE